MSVQSAIQRIAELSSLISGPAPAQAPATTSPAAGEDFSTVLASAKSAATQPSVATDSTSMLRTLGTSADGAAVPYAAEIDAAAAKYGIDPALLRALVKQESGFDPNAGSPAGAVGLCQLMPGTAASLGVTDPRDPVQSLDGGAKYLREQLDRFGGDVRKALAAYNAGPAAVERFGGVPPYPETQNYVQNILDQAPQASARALAAVPALPTTSVALNYKTL